MTDVDYYSVLGVRRNAAQADIKAAHKRLVTFVYPDRGGHVDQFRLVQEAYETLRDPVRRAAYDDASTEFAVEHPTEDEPAATAEPAAEPGPMAAPQAAPGPRSAPAAARPMPSWPVYPPVRRGGWLFLPIACLTLFVLLSDMGLVIADWVYDGEPAIVRGVLLVPAVVFVVLWMFGRRVPRPVWVGSTLFVLFLASTGVLAIARGDVVTGILVAMLVSGIVAVPMVGRRYHAARR